MALDPILQELLDKRAFAALTTLGPDGMPSTQVMWVDADDEHVMFNTEVERQKFRNVQRDPKVSLAVIDPENPYRYVEIRGEVVETVAGDEARAHIDRLSQHYTGGPYAMPIGSDRVVCKVRPDRIRAQG